MDVTPELIETVDFSEKFRGYDPEEVNNFLEKVGARIVELTAALGDAERRAEESRRSAEEAQRTAAAAPVPLTDEEEAAESTRTLMMATRTADAAIADAKGEAQGLVSSAQAESASMIEAARADADLVRQEAAQQAEETIRDAGVRAEVEFDGRREEIRTEIASLLETREGVAADVEALEARVGEYRGALDAVATRLTDILADPELLHERAPLDIDMTPVSTVVETTGHEASAPPPVPETATETATETAPETTPVPPPPDVAVPAAPIFVDPLAETPAPPPPPPAEEPAASPFSPAAGPFGPGPLDEVTESPFAAAADDAEPGGAPAEEPVADPWAPGSWSEVLPGEQSQTPADTPPASDAGHATSGVPMPDAPVAPALFETAEPSDAAPAPGDYQPSPTSTFSPAAQFAPDSPFAEPMPAAEDGAGAGQEFQVVNMDPEQPTGSFGGLSQDRFLRDLDAAVNSPPESEDDDDAMSAFLLGDDEAQARRFGRRR